jgi:hypothetical protein
METHDGVITRLDRARVALAEAKTIQDAKQLRDMATAAEIYARRQGLGDEVIGHAHAIKMEALRRLGEMLKGSEKNTGAKGLQGGGTCGSHKEPRVDAPPTYAEVG